MKIKIKKISEVIKTLEDYKAVIEWTDGKKDGGHSTEVTDCKVKLSFN